LDLTCSACAARGGVAEAARRSVGSVLVHVASSKFEFEFEFVS
jgi:hypothetical protein